ncbi:M48 family metalloprotease [Streptomyces sp. NPDC001941]|uniref:M48 family metallopeptidase n=1 Tax=Streptomyces sp. NPDC001941 TaxID=3154659 RepID=UPI0033205B84
MSATQACPECAAQVPVDERFGTWCEACGWNVDPSEHRPPTGRIEALRHRTAQRYGEQLYAETTTATAAGGSTGATGAGGRPQRGGAGALAQVLAVLVHGVTLALVVCGLLLIVLGWSTVVQPVIGGVLLATAVVLRPRFGRLPDDLPELRRTDAPRLFALIDEVAAVAGTRGVDVVVVDASANAAVFTYGIRQRRALLLGLALWEALTPQQRVALLGHELGHYANGDTRRGILLGSALRSLSLWYSFLLPVPDPDLGERLANVMMAVPRYAVYGLLLLLDQLTMRDGLRAEYLADDIAKRAASPEAAAELMDRLLIAEAYEDWLRRESVIANTRGGRTADRKAAERDLWERLAAHMALVPEREYERRRRAGALRGHAVDSTHPPTHLRRERLLAGTGSEPGVRFAPEAADAVGAELADARAKVAHVVIRDYAVTA